MKQITKILYYKEKILGKEENPRGRSDESHGWELGSGDKHDRREGLIAIKPLVSCIS